MPGWRSPPVILGSPAANEMPDQSRFLCDDLPDHLPVNIGQPPLDPIVVKRQLLVVQAQQVQDGGVEIMHRRHILHRLVPELVRRAITEARLDPRTR